MRILPMHFENRPTSALSRKHYRRNRKKSRVEPPPMQRMDLGIK
ncbi:MAG TPA: hypothetical protein VIX59_17540 [Candidatus Binataceae bacterium]